MAIKNVHGNTVDWFGEAILAGDYAVGASLPPEPILCAQLGVSRTVVRESIKSLVAKGLVSTGPKVGTKVMPTDCWNWFDPDVIAWQSKNPLTREFIRDLQELRLAVEPAAIRLAARRASALEIEVIEQAYQGMRRAVEEGGDYVSFDLRFHQGLMRASGNRMLAQMGKSFEALLRTSFELSTRKKDGPRQSLPLHRAVLDAVIAHNVTKAERAILKLIEGAHEDIELVLGSRRRLPSLSRPAPVLKAA